MSERISERKYVEEEISLTRNDKLGKGFVAKVNLDKKDIEFLRALTYSTFRGLYRLYENEFYIHKKAEGSWKHPNRSTYRLLTVENGEVKVLAEIQFDGGMQISGEYVEMLKDIYYNTEGNNKVVESLKTLAFKIAEEKGLLEKTVEEKIAERIAQIEKEFNVKIDWRLI